MECGRQEAEELGRRGAKIVRMFAGSKVQMFNASRGAGEFDRFMQGLALCHFLESPLDSLRHPEEARRRRTDEGSPRTRAAITEPNTCVPEDHPQ